MQEIIWKVRYFEIDYQKALKKLILLFFNSIQDWGGGGEGAKSPPQPTSFFPVTSTCIGISPKNFLTFSFTPFSTLV